MKIIIGSSNIVKINATKLAFQKYYPDINLLFENYSVSSLISDQPFGIEEILIGAKNRAINSKKKYLEKIKSLKNLGSSYASDVYFVGIEAGFVKIPESVSDHSYIDFQFCVIIDYNGRQSIGCGSGFEFPISVVSQLLNNHTLELGDIMANLSGNQNIKREEGAIGYYTKNKITRTDITQQAVEMAFIPFLNPDSYFFERVESPRVID